MFDLLRLADLSFPWIRKKFYFVLTKTPLKFTTLKTQHPKTVCDADKARYWCPSQIPHTILSTNFSDLSVTHFCYLLPGLLSWTMDEPYAPFPGNCCTNLHVYLFPSCWSPTASLSRGAYGLFSFKVEKWKYCLKTSIQHKQNLNVPT